MNSLDFGLKQDTENKLNKVLEVYADKDAFFRDVINYHIQRVLREQTNIQADLFEFEKQHGVSTKDFYSQYKSGQKGDDEDTLLWAGIYEMFMENEQKLSEIQ